MSEGEGRKKRAVKVFVKKRADPKLEADYEVSKTLLGIRDLRPGLGISKQNWSDFRVIDRYCAMDAESAENHHWNTEGIEGKFVSGLQHLFEDPYWGPS